MLRTVEFPVSAIPCLYLSHAIPVPIAVWLFSCRGRQLQWCVLVSIAARTIIVWCAVDFVFSKISVYESTMAMFAAVWLRLLGLFDASDVYELGIHILLVASMLEVYSAVEERRHHVPVYYD
jgi:hypothetical protein